ncbi:MAG: hypothetical protein EXQ88_03720 [Alphaproteobacteria bacterium]|nr:hypothetical protein [Alphaproteobacteria bacterium]
MSAQNLPSVPSTMENVESHDGANARKLRYMFGAVTRIELNNFLDGNSIGREERKQEIKMKWRDASAIFRELTTTEAGAPDRIRTEPLPPNAAPFLEELQAMPAFRKTFENYPPVLRANRDR